MNYNILLNYEILTCSQKHLNRNTRRAVSEVITALMLLSITVVGGVLVFTFFQGFDVTSILGSSSELTMKSIQLVGYDTRDSIGLSGVTTLDNSLDSKLCTKSCELNKDKIPLTGGTDFIVLTVRNDGLESIFVSRISINDVPHTFDSQTVGSQIDASLDAVSCTVSCPYPKSGKFSIISTLDAIQDTDSEIEVGQDARLVVKLSPDISSDITLPKPLKIQIDTNRLQYKEFIIPSGGVR